MNGKSAVAMAAMLLTSACGLWSSKDDVPQEAQPAPLREIEQPITLKQVWSYDAGAGFDEEYLHLVPAVQGDTVFVAGADGRITGLEAASGKVQWRVDLDSEISGAVGLGDGLVLLGTPEARVIALDARDGQKLWEQKVSSEVLAPPAVEEGVVVVRTVDGRLFGLTSSSGERIWEMRREVPSLSLRGSSPPLVRDGVAVAGFADGKLLAVEVRTGRTLWDVRVAQPSGRNEVERMIDIDATPILVGSVLYAASFQGRLMALSLGTRKILWVRDTSSYAGLDADSDRLYVSDDLGNVLAFDRLSGEVSWTQDTLQRRGLSGPAVAGEWIFVGDYEGYLHVLRRDDGKMAGRIRVGKKAVRSTPLTVGGLIITLSADGRVSAIRVGADT